MADSGKALCSTGRTHRATSLSRKTIKQIFELRSAQPSPTKLPHAAHRRIPSMPPLEPGNFISAWKLKYWSDRKKIQQPPVPRFPRLDAKSRRKLRVLPDSEPPPGIAVLPGRSNSQRDVCCKEKLGSPIEKRRELTPGE